MERSTSKLLSFPSWFKRILSPRNLIKVLEEIPRVLKRMTELHIGRTEEERQPDTCDCTRQLWSTTIPVYITQVCFRNTMNITVKLLSDRPSVGYNFQNSFMLSSRYCLQNLYWSILLLFGNFFQKLHRQSLWFVKNCLRAPSARPRWDILFFESASISAYLKDNRRN